MEDFIAAILMSEAFPNRILGELMRMTWILFLIFGIEVFMTWCMNLVEFIGRKLGSILMIIQFDPEHAG